MIVMKDDLDMEEYFESPNDTVLQSDIEEIARNEEYNFEDFNNKTILVTGATGLIGSQIVKTLTCINRIRKMNIKIIAFVRNKEKAERIFSNLLNKPFFVVLEGDIQNYIDYNGRIDYIIHAASSTDSKYFVTNPVETINTVFTGTKNILDFAKRNTIKGMIYLSSLEVYGKDKEKEVFTENDYGYIDVLNARSSYSEGKRMAECMCRAYFEEYDIPVKIARLAQTFGPGVDYNDRRVFAEFCRAAIEKRDIVLHTEGRTVRNYCYIKDAICAIFTILLKGNSGESYNVANKKTAISIKEMADLVCNTFPDSKINVRIEIPEDISQYGYNPEAVVKLDTTKIENLGWNPTTDLKNMFLNTVKSMKEKERM